MIKKIKISTGITALLLIAVLSCSKQRIEKPELFIIGKMKFISLNDFFDEHKKAPKTYEIKEEGVPYKVITDYIEVLVSNYYFIDTLTKDNPKYPYTFELTELISIKDLIFYNIEPTENEKLIELKGVFDFKFIKDNRLLYLKKYFVVSCFYEPEDYSINIYDDYKGIINNNIILWQHNESGVNNISHLSWTLFGIEPEFSTTNYTKLKFTSNKYDLTNIGIYIVFSDKNTFTRVKNQESIDLPVGEQAKLVAFSITNNGELYSYNKNITIGEQENYEINLYKTTDNNLTLLLDNL